MNVRLLFIILGVVWTGLHVQAADTLLKCITHPRLEREHRLDREAAILACYERFKPSLQKDLCYKTLKRIVMPMDSFSLTDRVRNICFYDAGPAAKDIASCLKESRQFVKAAEHDEAVFYCYQQFQDSMSTKDCLKTADQLIFPGKEDYLRQHCLRHAN